ncbi:MAG: gas vesicle protein GvpJ [Pseudomonadota bacterium]
MTQLQHPMSANGLGDILERVLDKGIVVAGDVSVSLVGIELLTIRLRLIVASVDKAKEIGINWWETDPGLSSRAFAAAQVETNPQAAPLASEPAAISAETAANTLSIEDENRRLRGRLAILEKRMADMSAA